MNQFDLDNICDRAKMNILARYYRPCIIKRSSNGLDEYLTVDAKDGPYWSQTTVFIFANTNDAYTVFLKYKKNRCFIVVV